MSATPSVHTVLTSRSGGGIVGHLTDTYSLTFTPTSRSDWQGGEKDDSFSTSLKLPFFILHITSSITSCVSAEKYNTMNALEESSSESVRCYPHFDQLLLLVTMTTGSPPRAFHRGHLEELLCFKPIRLYVFFQSRDGNFINFLSEISSLPSRIKHLVGKQTLQLFVEEQMEKLSLAEYRYYRHP